MALGTDLGTGMPDGAEAHYRASGETAGHKSRLSEYPQEQATHEQANYIE